ncbi:MAG: hypothetical protein V4659_03975 [Pseudomonadota bacterium]
MTVDQTAVDLGVSSAIVRRVARVGGVEFPRAPRPATIATQWDDARTLDVLDRWDRGDTAAAIGKALGVSRSAVLGVLQRVRVETDVSESVRDVSAPPASRPENINGGMPARWWVAGLRVRQRLAVSA